MEKKEIDSLTEKDIYPCIENEKYRNLLMRFMHSKFNDTDEFIISEAIQIYADLEDDDYDLKLRILELLKNTSI